MDIEAKKWIRDYWYSLQNEYENKLPEQKRVDLEHFIKIKLEEQKKHYEEALTDERHLLEATMDELHLHKNAIKNIEKKIKKIDATGLAKIECKIWEIENIITKLK